MDDVIGKYLIDHVPQIIEAVVLGVLMIVNRKKNSQENTGLAAQVTEVRNIVNGNTTTREITREKTAQAAIDATLKATQSHQETIRRMQATIDELRAGKSPGDP